MRSSVNSQTTSCVAAVKKGTAGEGVFSHCLKSTEFFLSVIHVVRTGPSPQSVIIRDLLVLFCRCYVHIWDLYVVTIPLM